MYLPYFFYLFACILQQVLCGYQITNTKSKEINPETSKYLPECRSCKLFIESLNKTIISIGRYTARPHRFNTAKDKVCSYMNENINECSQILSKAQDDLEKWWEEHDSDYGLYDYLCIKRLEYCCPKNHYGRECKPCETVLGNICNGNGKCRGDGTRKGNGSCLCDSGYEGDQCEKCSFGYYESFKDDTKQLCSPCNIACKDGCNGAGTKGCSSCKPGWKRDKDLGCIDINECFNTKRCQRNEFCINTPGSFMCWRCDLACLSCVADGPENCRQCAAGYSRVNEVCLKDPEVESDMLTATRHYTYTGLAVTSIILLTRSKALGSLVGAIVLLYIAGAEYYTMIMGHSNSLFDLKDFDLFQIFKKTI